MLLSLWFSQFTGQAKPLAGRGPCVLEATRHPCEQCCGTGTGFSTHLTVRFSKLNSSPLWDPVPRLWMRVCPLKCLLGPRPVTPNRKCGWLRGGWLTWKPHTAHSRVFISSWRPCEASCLSAGAREGLLRVSALLQAGAPGARTAACSPAAAGALTLWVKSPSSLRVECKLEGWKLFQLVFNFLRKGNVMARQFPLCLSSRSGVPLNCKISCTGGRRLPEAIWSMGLVWHPFLFRWRIWTYFLL